MLILGIILTTLGFIIFQWYGYWLSKSRIERPMIFSKPVATLVIFLIWVGLIVSGFIVLWLVNPVIVGVILGGYFVLWIIGYLFGSEKANIKRIFKIYKQLKLFRPRVAEEEILKETARLYFQRLHWDEHRINHILQLIFGDNKDNKVINIKNLVSSILTFEKPIDFDNISNFKYFLKQYGKRDELIDKIYERELGQNVNITEKPVLSEWALRRFKKMGLNPDEMSSEQLAALESLENIEKSHWIVKVFNYGTLFFGLSAIINLFTANFGAFVVSLVIALVLMYIGFRIQSKIAGRKFYEASIQRYAESQRSTNSK